MLAGGLASRVAYEMVPASRRLSSLLPRTLLVSVTGSRDLLLLGEVRLVSVERLCVARPLGRDVGSLAREVFRLPCLRISSREAQG